MSHRIQASIVAGDTDGETVAAVFLVTLVACCTGGITSLAVFKARTGAWKINPTINGALAGESRFDSIWFPNIQMRT